MTLLPTDCTLGCEGAGWFVKERSTSQVIARSKSYPLAASASSSSEGASVAPKTELSTSKGVMPSVSIAATSGSMSSSCFCFGGVS